MFQLADIFAAFVLWLAAAALSQFGVSVERHPEPPRTERKVARTPPRETPKPDAERAPPSLPAPPA